MLSDSDINFLNKYIPFYSKLNVEEQEQFKNNAFHTTFKNNRISYSSEKECSGLIIVLKGSLRAFLNSNEGKEIILYKLLTGD